MIIKPGEKKSQTYSAQTISGFTFKGYLVGNAVNKMPGGSDLDWGQITVKALLKRRGQVYTLFSDVALPLLLESAQRRKMFEFVHPAYAEKYIAVTQTASIKGECLKPAAIDFEGYINLKNSDEIEFEVYFPTQALSGDADTTSSYIEADAVEGIGVEWGIPCIVTQAISQGESRIQRSLGDNVVKVSYINTDILVETPFVANMPISSAVFASDKLSINDNDQELITKRLFSEPFLNDDGLSYLAQCYTLVDASVPLMEARLDLNLRSSLINSGKNFIVFRNVYTDVDIFNNASAMTRRHQQKNIRDLYGRR